MFNDNDEFTGTVGFNSLSECSKIAFHLLPKYWGRGIMSEASIAAIEWRRIQGTCLQLGNEPDDTTEPVRQINLDCEPRSST